MPTTNVADEDLDALLANLRRVLEGHGCGAAKQTVALLRDGIAARVAEERDACAAIADGLSRVALAQPRPGGYARCDNCDGFSLDEHAANAARTIAAQIRARGAETP